MLFLVRPTNDIPLYFRYFCIEMKAAPSIRHQVCSAPANVNNNNNHTFVFENQNQKTDRRRKKWNSHQCWLESYTQQQKLHRIPKNKCRMIWINAMQVLGFVEIFMFLSCKHSIPRHRNAFYMHLIFFCWLIWKSSPDPIIPWTTNKPNNFFNNKLNNFNTRTSLNISASQHSTVQRLTRNAVGL